MQWQKLGRIFNPGDHLLPNGCKQFAQSPQALVFDHFVRIYFSTRALDPGNGKFLSHIAFVDFSKDFRNLLQVSSATVLPLGALGCFDEHGIFPISPLRDGARILAYTTGWSRRISVSVETGIGLVISHDQGQTFQRLGNGPILSSSLHEPYLVGDAFVRKFDQTWHMWYIFGTHWKSYAPDMPPDRTYKIGHATSPDGLNWHRQGQPVIADQLGHDESQALPTVIRIDNRYHMFFCYRESFDFRQTRGRGYRIGHAWSEDLVRWIRDDEHPKLCGTADDWDSDMQCYPNVFACDDRIFLLYNGNEFGRHGFGLAELIP